MVEVFLFTTSKRALGPPILLHNGYWGSFPGAKRPGRKAEHSPQSTIKVKNDRIYTSTPPVWLKDVCRDNLTIHINKMETTKSIPLTFTVN